MQSLRAVGFSPRASLQQQPQGGGGSQSRAAQNPLRPRQILPPAPATATVAEPRVVGHSAEQLVSQYNKVREGRGPRG